MVFDLSQNIMHATRLRSFFFANTKYDASTSKWVPVVHSAIEHELVTVGSANQVVASVYSFNFVCTQFVFIKKGLIINENEYPQLKWTIEREQIR